MAALPIPDVTDLWTLPVGRREDGAAFAVRLQETHLLIAGATRAGKGSYLWGLVRALLPAMAAGLVRPWACDPKLMELAFGRALFDRYGRYAADPAGIADLLEDAVREMQARARRFAGTQRDHEPTPEHPFVVVLVDEIAFLTAYQDDRKGMRGNVLPARPVRRHRSTRRRQDAPDLPRRAVTKRTIGKTYTAPDGKTFRPSMFITLTCDSYGRVTADGTPANADGYDYQRAARDALHFAALFDRLIQNLRRFLGYDVQYFATVEPQRRLAPHVHVAMRGTLSRTELRQVLAATYHQVWWPPADEVKHDDAHLPVWHEASGN